MINQIYLVSDTYTTKIDRSNCTKYYPFGELLRDQFNIKRTIQRQNLSERFTEEDAKKRFFNRIGKWKQVTKIQDGIIHSEDDMPRYYGIRTNTVRYLVDEEGKIIKRYLKDKDLKIKGRFEKEKFIQYNVSESDSFGEWGKE